MSINNWKFLTDRVKQQQVSTGQYASAETTLIASGPPRLKQAENGGSTGTVYPIGMLESAGISQSKQVQRIYEIGSSRSYFIPGRVVGSLNLGRIFYYGPSLLRVLYAYYTSNANGVKIGNEDPGAIEDGTFNERENPNQKLLDLRSITTESLHPVQQSPGDDYFFLNLSSDMFNQATGLGFYFKDSNQTLIGANYLEDCMVQGHQIQISSGSVLIMEGASLQFDRAVPIRVTAAT